jgi:SulP family sulfate permease
MGYGQLGFAALGDAFVPQAILAGLYAPVCGCIVAVLLGANTTMIYSPRSIVTFLTSSLVLHSLARSDLPVLQSAPGATLLVLALLMTFLAGVFQALFGMLRLGNFVKYIPAPVLAGFQNAAAILIFFSQLDVMLGFRQHVAVLDIVSSFDKVQPLTLATGIVTCVLIIKGARITKRVPPTILGLMGGVALYYVFVFAGLGGSLGPTVAHIPFAWPSPRYLMDFMALAQDSQMLQVVPTLLTGAISLAIVASLDGMLCARLVEADSGNRVQNNLELIRLGVGNMASAAFGGIANGINLGSSFANHRSGARTPLSIVVHALVILFAILAFTSLISYLPRVVMAATLIVIAIQLFDRWTLQILLKLVRRGFASARSVLLDLLVILVVTTVAITLNIVFAVVIGIGVTALFFLYRMSKSVIRRAYRCDVVHSRRIRAPGTMDILTARGSCILVIELEGPLFFGTAENLAEQIAAATRDNVSYVVFDLKRVNEIDSTGARIIQQTHEKLIRDKKYLLLSALGGRPQLATFLDDMGVTASLTSSRLFPDADHAIEWAEDHLIKRFAADAGLATGLAGNVEPGVEFPIRWLDVFAHMTVDELAVVKSLLVRREYRKGDVVVREGEKGKELYIVVQGSASVTLHLPGEDRHMRLVAFSMGTVFGEVAMMDEEERSATVEADEDLVCYVLAHESYVTLTREHPAIAIKLLANLGREMSRHLRRSTRTIYHLAS